MGLGGNLLAIQAGSCAALASMCAKLAVSSDTTSTLLRNWFSNANTGGTGFAASHQDELVIAIRICAVAGMIMFNALMWVLFTKSMHLCSFTLEATIFNTSSNFVFTAVAGQLLFGEQLGLQWCVGSALLVIGLTVLHRDSHSHVNHSQGTTNKHKNHQQDHKNEPVKDQ